MEPYLFPTALRRLTSSNGTENNAKAFSFLNTWSDFLTVAVIPSLLATPSAALGDSVSSAFVAALPTRGDDVLEDHGGVDSLSACGSFGTRLRLSRSAAIRSSTRTTL